MVRDPVVQGVPNGLRRTLRSDGVPGILLEPVASRRAAEQMTPSELEDLVMLADEMRQLDDEREDSTIPSYARFSQIDVQLHDAIAAGGGKTYIPGPAGAAASARAPVPPFQYRANHG